MTVEVCTIVLGAPVTVLVVVAVTVPAGSVTVLVVAAHVPGAPVTVIVVVAVAPGTVVSGAPPPHLPNSGLQPSPQYSAVSPQYPAAEQQLPYTLPRQVYAPPQTPSLPSGLGTRVPTGPVEEALVVGTASAGLSEVQYDVEATRAQFVSVGFKLMNCVTVMP